jgi:hypothetical protein
MRRRWIVRRAAFDIAFHAKQSTPQLLNNVGEVANLLPMAMQGFAERINGMFLLGQPALQVNNLILGILVHNSSGVFKYQTDQPDQAVLNHRSCRIPHGAGFVYIGSFKRFCLISMAAGFGVL